MTFTYTPPSDEARRVVGWMLVRYLCSRRDGLDAEAFRKRYRP